MNARSDRAAPMERSGAHVGDFSIPTRDSVALEASLSVGAGDDLSPAEAGGESR